MYAVTEQAHAADAAAPRRRSAALNGRFGGE